MEPTKQSILIVDDIQLNLMVAERILQGAGYKVTTATSGADALDCIEGKRFDLVLLDIIMPDMDGYEVCRRIKKSSVSSSVPVIFMTSADSSDSLQAAFDAGGSDYITKPISKVELLSRVGNHLELQSRYDQLVSAKNDIDQLTRHDLKIPINGIISMSEQLLYGDNPKEREERFLNLILESSYSMLHNINTTHDLYKMEAGTYEFKHLKVDLIKVFDTIRIYHEQELSMKSQKINVTNDLVDLDKGKSFFVSGEDSLFISLFDQLIKNALEASDYNQTVTVDVQQVEERVIVKIHSNSTVPGEVRESFFDKYSAAGEQCGEGLGTYCAALIVSTLNGRISMDTSDEEGTTITVEVPAFCGA